MKKIMMMAAVCLMAAMTFAAQCAAITKKGTQCKRQASPGSEFCWQHGGTTKAERGEGRNAPSPDRKVRREEADEDEPAPMPRRKVRRPESGEEDAAPAPRRRVRRSESDEPEEPAPVAKPNRRRGPKAGTGSDVPPSHEAAERGMCQAMTKAGTPCKRKAQAGGRFCAQHAAKNGEVANDEPVVKPPRRKAPKAKAPAADDAPAAKPSRRKGPKAKTADMPPAPEPAAGGGMCQGKSKNGEPCKRKAKPGSNFCWQHDK